MTLSARCVLFLSTSSASLSIDPSRLSIPQHDVAHAIEVAYAALVSKYTKADTDNLRRIVKVEPVSHLPHLLASDLHPTDVWSCLGYIAYSAAEGGS